MEGLNQQSIYFAISCLLYNDHGSGAGDYKLELETLRKLEKEGVHV